MTAGQAGEFGGETAFHSLLSGELRRIWIRPSPRRAESSGAPLRESCSDALDEFSGSQVLTLAFQKMDFCSVSEERLTARLR